MIRAFWTWNPAWSTTYKSFNASPACPNNKWFFDKSVWQKMFRAMGGCGFNAIILANPHPFPYMIQMDRYPEAHALDDVTAAYYQEMQQWIVRTARDYEIAPYVLFSCSWLPEPMLSTHKFIGQDGAIRQTRMLSDLATEYVHYCVRQLLESYPDLAGVFTNVCDIDSTNTARFLQHAVVDAVDAARPDASLCLIGQLLKPEHFTATIRRRGDRPIRYAVSYTRRYLVDSNPDALFRQWVEIAGAANVIAEFRISNFEPWTSFSYETVEGILDHLGNTGCCGFSLQPLSFYDWPRSSDTFFRYLWTRDLVWYSVWGGLRIEDMVSRGSPKWLLRNRWLVPGFEAGSRILEILALYFAGHAHDEWQPQFCAVWDSSGGHLFSIHDMLSGDISSNGPRAEWWTEVTGDAMIRLSDYVTRGTPQDAYGPEELIDELVDLAEQAVAAGEKGMRSSSGEKELAGMARDAYCMGRLGEFYVERIKAALAHARNNNAEALEHMARAIGMIREIKTVDSSHRTLFWLTAGCATVVGNWLETVRALEAEYSDAAKGNFNPGTAYPIYRGDGTLCHLQQVQ